MNKRLLSILLVLCMVLVSVPVFAFSASATTPDTVSYEYVTSFSDNIPTVIDGTVTSSGNWEVFVYAKENNNGAGYYDGTEWQQERLCTVGPDASIFVQYEDALKDAGALTYGKIGGADTILVDAGKCFDVVMNIRSKENSL